MVFYCTCFFVFLQELIVGPCVSLPRHESASFGVEFDREGSKDRRLRGADTPIESGVYLRSCLSP